MRVVRLTEDTYIAEVVVKGPSGVTVVDARPSDAINLALLTEARVRAAADLLEAPALSDEQVDLEAYRDDAEARLGQPVPPPTLSPRLRKVLCRAERRARSRSDPGATTDDILAALLDEHAGLASRLMDEFGLDRDAVRASLSPP